LEPDEPPTSEAVSTSDADAVPSAAYVGPGASPGRSGRLFKNEPWTLQPNERVLTRSQPYLRNYIILLLVLAIPTVGLTALVAGFIWLYFRLMRFEWILTDRRVITVSGWLTRSAHNVSLDKINEINYRRNFLERVLFATGTIAIESAATAGVTLLKYAADDDPLRHALEEQLERRRRHLDHPRRSEPASI
jgi:uncharacterized membrane protein YdbT with pleckstrin-like domain